MNETAPLFLLHLIGFAGFLWLGLYVYTRGDRGRIATLTAATAILTAGFFLQGALTGELRSPTVGTVERIDWWLNVAPVALWLHLSVRLNPGADAARWRQPVLLVSYGSAALLVLVGTATNLISDYASSPIFAGPAYPLYTAYLFACTGFAAYNLRVLYRATATSTGTSLARHVGTRRPLMGGDGAASVSSTPRPASGATMVVETPGAGTGNASDGDGRLLVVGAVLFLIGSGYLALKVLLHMRWVESPAYLFLLAGLGAVGATVAVQSALLLGKDVRRDFVYRVVALSAVLTLYLLADGLLVGFGDLRRALFALLLSGLIAASDALQDIGRTWLDGAFFPPVVREERAAARAYAAALAVTPAGPHPDLATVKAFDDAVRRALTHLSDPTKLATTPLLNLVIVARGLTDQALDDNRLNRAAVLKDVLLDLLDGLKPHAGAGRVTSDPWRFYNCLYYPYVRGMGRRRAPMVLRQLGERRQREGGPRGELEQVLEWLLQVDEDTFYKWQRRGSDTIAAALRERERSAGGGVPGDGDVRGQAIPTAEEPSVVAVRP